MAKQLSSFQPNGVRATTLADTSLFSDGSLVSYWKMEGNSNDSKGSNNGTDTSITYSTANGKFGQGAGSDAGTDRIYLGNPASLQISGTQSINFWIKASSQGANNRSVFYCGGVDGVSDGAIGVFHYSGQTLAFQVSNGSSISSVDFTTGETSTLLDGNWHMVTFVFTASTKIEIFIDGSSFKSNSTGIISSRQTNKNWSMFSIETDQSATRRDAMIGNLDDFSFFSRALSASEIQTLYYAGSTKLYMPLNGNSVDISGNGNHGTDTAVTYVQGKFGQGARFNGSSSVVQIGTTTSLSFERTDIFTFSAWVKTTGSNVWNCIFAKMQDSGNYTGWHISTRANTTNKIIVNFVATTVNFFERFADVDVNDNKWHHILFTYNGNSTAAGVSIYIDGQIAPMSTGTNNTLSGTITNSSYPRLGSRDSGGLIYSGLLDEFIVESRAWTPQEISLYYRKSMLNYSKKSASLFSNFISYLLSATLQTYTLTGISNILNRGIRMLADVRTYALTGIANIFRLGKGLVAEFVSFALTGNATNFTKALRMLADVRTYTLTGVATTFIYIKKILTEVGEFIMTGYSVILRYKGWTKTPKDRGGIWTKTPKN